MTGQPDLDRDLREPRAARPRGVGGALPLDAGAAGRRVGDGGLMTKLAPGTQRHLMITAAWIFGIFLVVAFTFRRLDASQETLGVIAGISAYVFLAAAAFILWRGWRRGSRDAGATARRFAEGHPAVVEALGEPVEADPPEGEVPSGSGAAQANLTVPVRGPEGDGPGRSGDGADRAPLGGAVGDAGRGRRPGTARRGASRTPARTTRRRRSGGGFQHGPARGAGRTSARRPSTGTAGSSRSWRSWRRWTGTSSASTRRATPS